MIRAIIFDFDGLILDTESPIYHSWQVVYQEHGQQLPFELWATVIGTYEEPFDPYVHLEELLGCSLDKEPLLAKRRAHELQLITQQPVLPGVAAYLQGARQLGLKIGLASSSTCQWVVGHLERLGLRHYFDAIRAREDVAVTKPDPALYLAVMQELGIKPGEGIALEDSPNGVQAAKRAGLFCVAVPNPLTRSLPLDHADLRLESLAEMPLGTLIHLAEHSQPERHP